MKKKIYAVMTASAIMATIFSGMAMPSYAAVGDVLSSQDFTSVEWTRSRTDKNEATYSDSAEKFTTLAKPATVDNKSLVFDTQTGQNLNVDYTISPAITTSGTGVYKFEYDMILSSGDYDGTSSPNREYNIGFGSDTNGSGENMMFGFRVSGDVLKYYNGTNAVETTITNLTPTGQWFHFEIVADTGSKKYNAVITPYDKDNGEALTDSKVVISGADFYSNTTEVKGMRVASIRYDGGNKGKVNSALDNFVVTESEVIETTTVTINYVDETGATIKSETDTAEIGKDYTVADAKTANMDIDADNYYKFDAEKSTTTIPSVDGSVENVITLTFTKTAKPTYKIEAKTADGTVIKELASGKAVPGEQVTYYATIVVQDAEGKYYAKAPAEGETTKYRYIVDVAEADTEATVTYALDENIVYYKEAEDFEGAGSDSSSLTNDAGSSGGMTRQPAAPRGDGFKTDAVAAGTYTVEYAYGLNKRGVVLSTVAADGTAREAIEDVSQNGHMLSYPIAVNEGTAFKLSNPRKSDWNSDNINNVDYIIVRKAAWDVPKLSTLAEDAADVKSWGIDSVDTGMKMSVLDEGQSAYTAVTGVAVSVGSYKDTLPNTFVSVDDKADGKKLMTLSSAGKYSNAARAPKLEVTDELQKNGADLADGQYAVMDFNVMLNDDYVKDPNGALTASNAQLVFLGTGEMSESTNTYPNVIKKLTTAEEAEGMIKVASGEWMNVKFAYDNKGAYKLYINGEVVDEAANYTTTDGKSTKTVTAMPALTLNATTDEIGSRVVIDDLKTYVSADPVAIADPQITVAEDGKSYTSDIDGVKAVIVKASYDEQGRFTGAELFTDIKAGTNEIAWKTAPVASDKVMAFASIAGIKPLLAEAVSVK